MEEERLFYFAVTLFLATERALFFLGSAAALTVQLRLAGKEAANRKEEGGNEDQPKGQKKGCH